ncbi:MAG: hypothetical protein HRT99_02505 [Mycoplasmatales bacterium]|nr:hypothetical protein [Mycoplasmatales bacterium]
MKIYLTTDTDREREAIANQLVQVLKLKNYERFSFNEISKKAVEKAIEKPAGLDTKLVEVQETRRIIDCLYGVELKYREMRKWIKNLNINSWKKMN